MANIEGAMAPAPKAAVKDVTTASFRADVLTASQKQPVLVDFWAPWCGPCKQLAPALERAVADTEGKVVLVKMNIDEHPQIAGQLGIQSIPAVIAFDRGQPVDGFVGALPESQIRGFIERIAGPLSGGNAALLAEAEEAAAKGDAAGAAADLFADPGRGPGRDQGDRRPRQASGRGRSSSTRRARCSKPRLLPRRGRKIRRSPPPGRRFVSPSRRRMSASLRPSNRRSRPIPTIIRRASIWRWRSRPRTTARRPPTSCWRSSSAIATGTSRRRASSFCNCSKPGA